MDAIYHLFDEFSDSRELLELLQRKGVIDGWVRTGLKSAENEDWDKFGLDEKVRGLAFLSDCWLAFPAHFAQGLQVDRTLIDLLKRGARSPQNSLKLKCIELLFKLLDAFAQQKNPVSPLIYKTLTFFLIENYSETDVREFMLRNFMIVFAKFQSIPVDISLEPFVKQIHVSQSNFFMNIVDIEFLQAACKHRNINIKLGVQLADMMVKVYVENPVFSKALFPSIQLLVQRFLEFEAFQQFLQQLTEAVLHTFVQTYLSNGGNG